MLHRSIDPSLGVAKKFRTSEIVHALDNVNSHEARSLSTTRGTKHTISYYLDPPIQSMHP